MALSPKLSPSIMAEKRISNKMFDRSFLICHTTPKIRFFLVVMAIATILFIIYLDSFLFDLNSPHSFHFKSKEILREPKTHHEAKLEEIPPIVNNELEIAREINDEDEDEDEDEDDDPLIPPKNIMETEERIAWFRLKLPGLGILHSNNSTQRFHSRVLEFLSHGNCSLQFFMTWLSPAKSFRKRELWALESLFKVHPKACLVITSTSLDSVKGYRILKPFLDRGLKILAVEPDLPFLVKNTSAEAWLEEMKTGTKDPGSIPLSQNLSNLMRLVMLYKYGGVYLDTDVIVLRDFTELRNTLGAQSVDAVSKEWTRLNGAVMVFDINHPLLLHFLEEFALTFDGNRWGHNGPYLVSRVVERVTENRTRTYYNFTVLPPKAFYPVTWHKIERLMKKPVNESEERWVERTVRELNYGGTYVVHLWRRQSRDSVVEEGSVVARLISYHCLISDNIS